MSDPVSQAAAATPEAAALIEYQQNNRAERHRVERANGTTGPNREVRRIGTDTTEAKRGAELARPWEVHNWLDLDAEPMQDPGWLIAGCWPADAYGIIAAESKAGKTWVVIDLATSVAAGVPFLGEHEVPQSGPVIVYSGEGGGRNLRRRVRALLASKGIEPDDPRIGNLHVVTKPPRLADPHHIRTMKEDARRIRPRLIVLDPLYLSLGANLASLNEVGAELAQLQQVAEDVGAALVVVHHWNKTGTGTGRARMSGAGPEQWGRVLWSIAVRSKSALDEHEHSSVTSLDVEISGGELADLSFSIRRTIYAEGCELIDPLHYEVTASPLIASSGGTPEKGPGGHSAKSGPGRCLAILSGEPDRWHTVDEVQERTADEADADPTMRPLKRDTVGKALAKLHDEMRLKRDGTAGGAGGGGYTYRVGDAGQ